MLLLLSVAACGGPMVPTASPPDHPTEFALPTMTPLQLPPGAVEVCAGIGIEAVLRGEESDPRFVWLVTRQGSRFDVVWPANYHARFASTVEVTDEHENVVLRDGSPVDGGCLTRDSRILYLAPPFR